MVDGKVVGLGLSEVIDQHIELVLRMPSCERANAMEVQLGWMMPNAGSILNPLISVNEAYRVVLRRRVVLAEQAEVSVGRAIPKSNRGVPPSFRFAEICVETKCQLEGPKIG